MSVSPHKKVDYAIHASVAVDELMNEFERIAEADKASCIAFGASLIEVIKTHKWSWEEGETDD